MKKGNAKFWLIAYPSRFLIELIENAERRSARCHSDKVNQLEKLWETIYFRLTKSLWENRKMFLQ